MCEFSHKLLNQDLLERYFMYDCAKTEIDYSHIAFFHILNSLVCEDHFESTYYEVDKVNKVFGLLALWSISEWWRSLPTSVYK